MSQFDPEQTSRHQSAVLEITGVCVTPSGLHKLVCDANFRSWTCLNCRVRRCGTPHGSIQEGVDMRAHRIFLSLAIALGGGITLHGTAFSQENRGTWEQQMACTPDVWRLCGAQVPDVDRIVACLRRNTEQLSGRCRAVFAQGDNAPRRGEDRDYGQRGYVRHYGPRPYRDYGPRPYRDYGPRPYDDDDQ